MYQFFEAHGPMRHELRFVFTLAAASVALSACNDQSASAPTIPRGVHVNADVLPACNFTQLKSDVRNYVASGNDPIYDIIRDLQQATTLDAAYTFGMQGLARLATVRSQVSPVLKKTGATAVQGGAAVVDFLACMPVGEVQAGFETNIVKAMGIGGMFEVPLEAEVVYSRGKTPFWYSVPKTGNWGDLLGKRVMVFGYEISNIPGNSDGVVGGGAFDFNTVPMLATGQTFGNPVLLGACGIAGANARFKHVNSILVNETIDCLGSAPSLASLSTNSQFNFASFARRSINLFAPQPLYAATSFSLGIGGGVDSYSPGAVVTVIVTLSFQSQPVGGPISEPLNGTDGTSVKVLVTTPAGSLLEHAFVKLEVTGNSGLNALFYDPTLPSPGTSAFVTRETNANGIADFTGVRLTKAGGYTLTASVDFDDIQGTPIISNNGSVFNMTNK
jgi:hypothetical protein